METVWYFVMCNYITTLQNEDKSKGDIKYVL